jgi:hypothetical protein
MKLFEVKNQPAPWMLTESAKNTHLEHLEDLIFNSGYAGAQAALDYVESLRQMLADGVGTTTQLTVKWDGSPAIICGIDPADSKFFVGTKSVFAKAQPKICKDQEDILDFYGDKPELANKLSQALKYLSKLGIGGVVQGDLMFTEGDVTTVEIDNELCYVFTPNTITYAVPVNSNLGQRISRAKIGIVFHTSYDGDSIATMQASFGVNVGSFAPNTNVWFDDATYKDYTGVASLTPSENTNIQQYLQTTADTMNKVGQQRFDIILTNKEFARNIKPYINQMVRQGSQVTDPTQFLKQFVTHYTTELMKDIETLSGGIEGRAAQGRIAKIKEKEQWIADNSNALLGILAVYKRIIELKRILLAKLTKVEGIGTFQKTNDGYKVTAPEGFVAIGHAGGAVKLVDRLEFSRINFSSR